MAQSTHYLSPGVLKFDFAKVNGAMLQGVERPSEHIFCILGIQKSDMEEVAEVMIK
jgi:hypothetical protein